MWHVQVIDLISEYWDFATFTNIWKKLFEHLMAFAAFEDPSSENFCQDSVNKMGKNLQSKIEDLGNDILCKVFKYEWLKIHLV